MKAERAKSEDFARIYGMFEAPIARFDCARHCAPLNGGEPICCSTKHAVPVVDRAEWRLLKRRTDLWRLHRPRDREGRRVVAELDKSCLAIECKGARYCERDNRSLACRAFPFFAYIDAKGEFIGLSIHWTFADRCWVISNLEIVDPEFRRQFVAAYEFLFKVDPGELEVHKQHSANQRRVFSRQRRPIPLIDREGRFFKILPHGGGMQTCQPSALPKYGPYRSERSYRAALRGAESAASS
jgi:hypothetical protein